MKNRYILLRLRMLVNFIRNGKVSFRKLYNLLRCGIAFATGSQTSGATPFLVTIETWNECNERCVFCRNAAGQIYDTNAAKTLPEIPKGKMELGTVRAIIDELKDDLLLAVLYINGEPLIYKDIFSAIRHCTDNHVATMIASNGILLTPENSQKLMEAGLDLIKVHVSGFTQAVHSVQHRVGDIEKIKDNLRAFAKLREQHGHQTLLLVDYILYRHNEHEAEQFRSLCRELDVPINLRPGFPRAMEDGDAKFYTPEPPRLTEACDWPWKVLSINWDGTLYPCCEYTVFSGAPKLGRFVPGETSLRQMWNGPTLMGMRATHAKRGRVMPVCCNCSRKGTAFRF